MESKQEDRPLLCPHNQPVQIGEIDGVMHYGHEDGGNCDLLNRFLTTCVDMLGAKDTGAAAFAAFCCSRKIRLAWYTFMSQANEKHLTQALETIIGDWWELLPNQTEVCSEMDTVFGRMIWDNVELVSPRKVGVFHAMVPVTGLPSFPMLSLRDTRITGTFLDIDAAVKSMKRRLK